MSNSIEPGCLKITDIEPEVILHKEHCQFDNSTLGSYDLILDNSTLGSYDLIPISKLLSYDDV